MSISSLVIDAENGTIKRIFPSGIVHENVGSLRSNGYLQIRVDGKMIKVHRLIYSSINGPIPDGFEIDHINGIRTDNRISNLRCVTRQENQQNKQRPLKNNKLGAKGVVFDKKRGRFKVAITVMKKKIHLGYFDTLADACNAYKDGALMHHTHNPSAFNVITFEGVM